MYLFSNLSASFKTKSLFSYLLDTSISFLKKTKVFSGSCPAFKIIFITSKRSSTLSGLSKIFFSFLKLKFPSLIEAFCP